MMCVFLRSQLTAALVVAGLTSGNLSAQTALATPGDSSSRVAHSDSGPPPRFPIVRDGKWGLIDARGNELVPPRYDDLASCAGSSGRSMTPRNVSQSVRDGVLLKDCAPLRQDLISVSVGGYWGAVDVEGREVIAPTLDGIRIWPRLVAAREGDKWGILDRTGQYTIPPRFESVTSVSDLTAARVDGKWGLIDAQGQFFLTPQLDQAPLLFSGDDFLLAARDDRWGLLNSGGTWTVEPKFDRIYRFRNGLGTATLGGKMGYIDSAGTWVLEPRYEVAAPFGPEGPALVTVDDEEKYIDRAGNVVYVMEFPGLGGNLRMR